MRAFQSKKDKKNKKQSLKRKIIDLVGDEEKEEEMETTPSPPSKKNRIAPPFSYSRIENLGASPMNNDEKMEREGGTENEYETTTIIGEDDQQAEVKEEMETTQSLAVNHPIIGIFQEWMNVVNDPIMKEICPAIRNEKLSQWVQDKKFERVDLYMKNKYIHQAENENEYFDDLCDLEQFYYGLDHLCVIQWPEMQGDHQVMYNRFHRFDIKPNMNSDLVNQIVVILKKQFKQRGREFNIINTYHCWIMYKLLETQTFESEDALLKELEIQTHAKKREVRLNICYGQFVHLASQKMITMDSSLTIPCVFIDHYIQKFKMLCFLMYGNRLNGSKPTSDPQVLSNLWNQYFEHKILSCPQVLTQRKISDLPFEGSMRIQ